VLEAEVRRAVHCVRTMVTSLCVSIERAEADPAKLEATRTQLKATTAKIGQLLTLAQAEPDVKKLPFPAFQTRTLQHALEAIGALVGPAIAAVLHELSHRQQRREAIDVVGAREPLAAEPAASASALPLPETAMAEKAKGTCDAPACTDEDDTLPTVVFEQLRRSMGLMTLVVDELMRGIEASEEAVAGGEDTTVNLIHLHARVEAASQELTAQAHAVFFARARSARPSPYRMPALHVAVHFFNLLPVCLHNLLTAAVEYQKARVLRG
jgi:hypothetical protein